MSSNDIGGTIGSFSFRLHPMVWVISIFFVIISCITLVLIFNKTTPEDVLSDFVYTISDAYRYEIYDCTGLTSEQLQAIAHVEHECIAVTKNDNDASWSTVGTLLSSCLQQVRQNHCVGTKRDLEVVIREFSDLMRYATQPELD